VERIFLGLGSNRGDSLAILEGALEELGRGLEGLRASSIWRSEARYLLDQPPFLNLVVEARTDLPPLELLAFTQVVEAGFGRDRSREIPKGPRSLDIDILLYGEQRIELPGLVLPHPGIEERRFVLLPLLELDGSLGHPLTGLGFLASLAALPPQGIYLLKPRSYDLPYIY